MIIVCILYMWNQDQRILSCRILSPLYAIIDLFLRQRPFKPGFIFGHRYFLYTRVQKQVKADISVTSDEQEQENY